MRTNKLSCKKRKLKYIRSKNNLRNGGSLFWSFKASNDFYTDQNLYNIVVHEIEKFKDKVSRLYKMSIGAKVTVSTCGGDFIHDRVTVRIECKHTKGQSFVRFEELDMIMGVPNCNDYKIKCEESEKIMNRRLGDVTSVIKPL